MHILHKDDVKKVFREKRKVEGGGGRGDRRKCQKGGNAINEGYKFYSTCTVQVPGTYVLRGFRERPHKGPEGKEGNLCLKDSRERGNVV